jgi:hypothetical protein
MKVSVGPIVHTLERLGVQFVGRIEHLGKANECMICCRSNCISDHRREM